MSEWQKMIDRFFQREYETLLGSCTNAVSEGPALSYGSIMESMERVRRIMEQPVTSDPAQRALNSLGFGGIRVFETPIAVRRERIKTYPKRKAKSASHLARMEKKWRKRYGFREVPQMYIMQACKEIGTPGGLVVHPSQVALLRNFT